MSPDLGSSTAEVSIILSSPSSPPPQQHELGAGTATAVVTAMKKRKMAFPKSRYVERGGFGFLLGSLIF
jgi:hypothetical protein